MNQVFLHPIGLLDGSLSPLTALCFMLKDGLTYLLGGSSHGCFWIYDLVTKIKLNQILLEYAVVAIHHHETQWYEIITQELLGKLTFWGLAEDFRFVAYHTIFGDSHPPLSIIANHYILFPQQYRIRILNLDELKCIVPKATDLCELVDWEFGKHTTLFSIKVNKKTYIISGYISGSLIIREFKSDGLAIRLKLIRPSAICSIAYNPERQELLISDQKSVSLAIILIYIDADGNLILQAQQEIFIGGGGSILTVEPENTYLLCGRQHGMMKILNMRTSEYLSISPLQLINSIKIITCSPDEVAGWDKCVFAVAYANGFISVWTFDNYVQYVPYLKN